MTDKTWPDFTFPEKETNRLVLVTKLASSTSDKVIKDFFLFCGKIEQFQVITEEDGSGKLALVLFEKENAAKTAYMLNNAMVGEQNIVVEPYYKSLQTPPTPASTSDAPQPGHEANTSRAAEGTAQPTSFLGSILSTGYQLSQQVYNTTKELDTKYGVSTQAKVYYDKAVEETKKLDEKYHVTEKATELDTKLGIRSTINTAAVTVTTLSHQALETEPGKKVSQIFQQAVHTAQELKDEALKAANLTPLSPPATHSNPDLKPHTETLFNAESTSTQIDTEPTKQPEPKLEPEATPPKN